MLNNDDDDLFSDDLILDEDTLAALDAQEKRFFEGHPDSGRPAKKQKVDHAPPLTNDIQLDELDLPDVSINDVFGSILRPESAAAPQVPPSRPPALAPPRYAPQHRPPNPTVMTGQNTRHALSQSPLRSTPAHSPAVSVQNISAQLEEARLISNFTGDWLIVLSDTTTTC